MVSYWKLNEFLLGGEKIEGNLRPNKIMQPINDYLDECGPFDLGFIGTSLEEGGGYSRTPQSRSLQ